MMPSLAEFQGMTVEQFIAQCKKPANQKEPLKGLTAEQVKAIVKDFFSVIFYWAGLFRVLERVQH